MASPQPRSPVSPHFYGSPSDRGLVSLPVVQAVVSPATGRRTRRRPDAWTRFDLASVVTELTPSLLLDLPAFSKPGQVPSDRSQRRQLPPSLVPAHAPVPLPTSLGSLGSLGFLAECRLFADAQRPAIAFFRAGQSSSGSLWVSRRDRSPLRPHAPPEAGAAHDRGRRGIIRPRKSSRTGC